MTIKYFLPSLLLLSVVNGMDRQDIFPIGEENSFLGQTNAMRQQTQSVNDSFVMDDSDDELREICSSLRFNSDVHELESFKNKFVETTTSIERIIENNLEKISTLTSNFFQLKLKYEKAKEAAFKYKNLYEQVKSEKDTLLEEKTFKGNLVTKNKSLKSDEKICMDYPRRLPNSHFSSLLTEIEEKLGKNFIQTNLEDSFKLVCNQNFLTKFASLPVEKKKELLYGSFIEFFLRAINFDNRLTKEDIFVFFSSHLKTDYHIDLKQLNLLQTGYVQDFLDKSEFVQTKRLTRSVRLPLQRDRNRSSSLQHSQIRVFKNK